MDYPSDYPQHQFHIDPIFSVYVVRKLNEKHSDRVNAVVDVVKQVTEKLKLRFLEETHQIQTLNTVIVAVGGDGTMLEAMKLSAWNKCPALGINLGNVGFLTDFSTNDMLAQNLEKVLKQYPLPIEQRMGLSTYTDEIRGQNAIAFNEVVVSPKYSDGLLHYRLRVGNHDAGIHRANALIVGTPTGSTAYTLSAGGALILPSMHAIQVVPVAPISMTSRPIIAPAEADIGIWLEKECEWVVKCDGQVIREGDWAAMLTVRHYKHVARIIHPEGWSFFNMLTNKLGWKST